MYIGASVFVEEMDDPDKTDSVCVCVSTDNTREAQPKSPVMKRKKEKMDRGWRRGRDRNKKERKTDERSREIKTREEKRTREITTDITPPLTSDAIFQREVR